MMATSPSLSTMQSALVVIIARLLLLLLLLLGIFEPPSATGKPAARSFAGPVQTISGAARFE